jgi:hypothetical protein
MKANFYSELKAFKDFSQLTNIDNFIDVPNDWVVVLTDLRGSTKAIQAGRYKDVNLIGAASVTCVLNVLDSNGVPFVFGGDGATLLVPKDQLEIVNRELIGLKKISLKEFGLELRVGYVPISLLKSHGANLKIGKYELTPGNYTAQFRGNALTLAEDMIKKGKPEGATLLNDDPQMQAPNLNGLSCRLEPLYSKNGCVLSILIKPLTENPKVLQEIMSQVKSILNDDFHSVSPVHAQSLKWNWLPKSILSEVILQKVNHSAGVQWILTVLRTIVSKILLTYNISLGPFDPKKYKSELVRNSDFKKFDETLRMVIDCSIDQVKAITEFLEKLKKDSHIKFGLHQSDRALMTCIVFSASNNHHIHFIDGGNGGYAMAASQMKAQI